MRTRAAQLVRRPADEVAAFATDPDRLLAQIRSLGRFDRRGSDTWDVFVSVGTLHIGGLVRMERPDPSTLTWHSVRGTRHEARLEVTPDGDAESVVRMEIDFGFRGLVVSRLAELVGRGVVRRHIEAVLEEIRHHLEWGG